MLSNNETNSNVVEIQQFQQDNTTLSSEDLLKHMQSLEKRIKSLEVTNRVILGLFIGTLAAAITVGAGFAIAAAPIIASSIVGGILATAALAALGVTAYKYRAEIKAGFKYAAEKTVDGAKYTAGKVRDGAVPVKDKVKEGYEHSVDSLKRGTHLVNTRAKEKVSNVLTTTADKLYRAAGNENYSDRIDNELIPDSRQKKKVKGIKEDFRAIVANGEDNSTLIKSILSGISSKIAEKIAGETYLDFRDYLPNQEVDRWKEQKRFVDNLDASSLHDLITKRMLDKSKYFRDSIFSEHYGEIKEVIVECKEDHILKGSLEMRNKMFEEGSARPSRSFSLPSFSLLGRNNSEQSNSLLRSSSMSSLNSNSTDGSTAGLLNPANHKEVKAPSSFREKMPSWLGGKKAPEETTNVKYQVLSEPGTLSRQVGESTFYVAPPKPPRSNSLNSIGTESTATVSDSDSQNFATVRRSNSSSSLTPKLTPVAPPELPRSASLTNLNELNASSQNSLSEEFGSNPIRADNEVWYDAVTTLPGKGTLTHSNSTDSGMGSGSSTPKSPSVEDLSKARAELKKTGYLDKWVGQPSTKVDEIKPESTQMKTVR